MRRFAVAAIVAVLALSAAGALTSAFAQVGPLDAMRAPPATGIAGWIVAKQSLFYRELSGLIRAAKTDGSALWGLMGVSFLYGILPTPPCRSNSWACARAWMLASGQLGWR